MACSIPPMYWSTGVHLATASAVKGIVGSHGSQKRRKYHDESTNVSIVSVSRRAGPPHVGQVVFTHSGTCANGESPRPVNVAMCGNSTGNCSYGTATTPCFSQWTTGIG